MLFTNWFNVPKIWTYHYKITADDSADVAEFPQTTLNGDIPFSQGPKKLDNGIILEVNNSRDSRTSRDPGTRCSEAKASSNRYQECAVC